MFTRSNEIEKISVVKTTVAVLVTIVAAWASTASGQTSALFNPDGSLNKPLANQLFLFGRAKAFHDMSAQRDCRSADGALITSINQRLDEDRSKLAEKYSDKLFPKNSPGVFSSGPCDQATVSSYANHVAELDQAMSSDR